MILQTPTLPGVVMLELDGILTIQNGDAAVVHEVDLAQQQTGYDGSGVTVAVIDTGIDSTHAGLDDLDDDDSTYDPKVIGFYDPVNNPDKTNGTEIQAYDDQGHGSHCAGTVAGTGAPTFEHPGMAPIINEVASYIEVTTYGKVTIDCTNTCDIKVIYDSPLCNSCVRVKYNDF